MDKATRNAQLARIHIAKQALGMDDAAYRDFLEGLTGLRSCAKMSDRQVNHVLDWMMHFRGERPQPQNLLGRDDVLAKAHLVSKARELGRQAPPHGWQTNPLQSAKFQARLLGKAVFRLEELNAAQLIKLIEATKSIYRRAAKMAATPKA
jgi:phage gp16-like protein